MFVVCVHVSLTGLLIASIMLMGAIDFWLAWLKTLPHLFFMVLPGFNHFTGVCVRLIRFSRIKGLPAGSV
jgi:hypothetical protein